MLEEGGGRGLGEDLIKTHMYTIYCYWFGKCVKRESKLYGDICLELSCGHVIRA